MGAQGLSPSSALIHATQLYDSLKIIFPNTEIFKNVKKELNIKYPNSGSYMEFDVWIPIYNVAFEFQDAYHYLTMWYYHNTQSHIQQKDYIKKEMAYKLGMTLFVIPCWWNGKLESLKSCINFNRPDLLFTDDNVGPPINLNPPNEFFNEITIPGVGELMLASFPLYNNISLNDNIWWMGEKYDGIRSCWNSFDKKIYSRYGKILPLSKFIHHLPSEFVDGELWFGRGSFADTYSLLNSIESLNTAYTRLILFDLPSYIYQQLPYEDRYKYLLQAIGKDNPFCVIVPRVSSENCSISWFVHSIIETEGEGIILQKIKSFYEQGRSLSLIKLKTSPGDQEGIVVSIAKDNTVSLKLPNGTLLDVPPQSVHVKAKIGDVVSFSHESNTRRDIPVNPKIFRIRTDISWDDVLSSFAKEKNVLSETSYGKGFTTKAKGHWTPKNMRVFMEKFARNRNLDPLVPETWYNSLKSFSESKGGRTILRKFKNGYYQALRNIFPDVLFDIHLFRPEYHKIENRRKFFENYAHKKQFDPLKPDNWYLQSVENIMDAKGSHRVVFYHGRSIPTALIDLFPNIGLEKHKFPFAQPVWNKPENRRRFFEDYAKANDFDSLDPSCWYNQPLIHIMASKGSHRVIFHHKRSVAKALIDLFPEVEFDKSKFLFPQTKTADDRQKILLEYAEENNFDAFTPENWYSQPMGRLLAVKGIKRIIFYHGNSLPKALSELFPNIGIDKSKFPSHKLDWKKQANRRIFFENFAYDNGFSPLHAASWHSQSMSKIKSAPGVYEVISHHGHSVTRALLELFPNIGLEKSKLLPQTEWHKREKRQQFFVDFAGKNDFDPYIAENWYLKHKIKTVKGAKRVLGYHDNSVRKALLDLFPNIGLESSKMPYKISVNVL